MPTLVPPQPSLLQSPGIHSPVSVWRSVPHQDGSIVRVGTSPGSTLCPQNAAGISYPMCSTNEHLSTLKPENLLESLLTHPGHSRTGSSLSFPTRTCYKWIAYQLALNTGLGFHKPMGVGSWGPRSVTINSPALSLPLCSDFYLSHSAGCLKAMAWKAEDTTMDGPVASILETPRIEQLVSTPTPAKILAQKLDKAVTHGPFLFREAVIDINTAHSQSSKSQLSQGEKPGVQGPRLL